MDFLDKKIGEEKPLLQPKIVDALSVTSEKVQNKDGKVVGDKLIIECRHPDAKENMKISKVKFLGRGDKLKESGLWLTEDDEGNLPYSSAIANMLRHYRLSSIADIKGKKLETTTDSEGYIIIKAY